MPLAPRTRPPQQRQRPVPGGERRNRQSRACTGPPAHLLPGSTKAVLQTWRQLPQMYQCWSLPLPSSQLPRTGCPSRQQLQQLPHGAAQRNLRHRPTSVHHAQQERAPALPPPRQVLPRSNRPLPAAAAGASVPGRGRGRRPWPPPHHRRPVGARCAVAPTGAGRRPRHCPSHRHRASASPPGPRDRTRNACCPAPRARSREA
mmetsp:Transcript_81906/g.244220  ORF Transcript_81906/g.244220 Transcript_81906/m.244220 type:complete len:203 (+) Transcript_81906:673-1281(+)